jgi:hypothetical protein
VSKRFNIGLLWVFIGTISLAQVRQERDYVRSYPVNENDKVEVTSKYGEVIIRTWGYDSIKFDVVVKAEGKSSEAVRKSMSRVDVRFRKVGSLISATTAISSSGGFFGSLTNQLEGVVGNNKIQVDYEIWMPENLVLSVSNKYGDVYLADLANKVELDVSHGDIKAGNLDKELELKHHYGKSSFRKVGQAIVNLRGAEMDIEDALLLNVESGSSEIHIDKAQKLQFNSRNDKIRVASVRQITCEGTFTDLTLDHVIDNALLDFNYGDIYIGQIDRDFDNISITGGSTDINVILDQASFIRTFIKGPEDKMILPNSMLTMQKQAFEEGLISLSGDVGPPNTRFSELKIDTSGGELIISIKETPLFSGKN